MNVVFLFLTRSDLDAVPRISHWLEQQDGAPHTVLAFVNPHLAIDPSPDQVGLENRILDSMRASLITDDERMMLEMTLQKRWMQIPRDVMVSQLEHLFEPFGLTTKTGLVILSESFQADRLSELLTKMRPAWPSAIPLGQFALIFANQVPQKREAGRPPGPVKDPEKRKTMLENLAKAREAKKKAKYREMAEAAVGVVSAIHTSAIIGGATQE
jgi:hypothetical protein